MSGAWNQPGAAPVRIGTGRAPGVGRGSSLAGVLLLRALAGVLLPSSLAVRIEPVCAQELDLGWEDSAGEHYSYASLTLLRGAGKGTAALLRVGASHAHFRLHEPAGETRVGSPGIDLGLGVRHETERWLAEAVAGLELRRTTDRTPVSVLSTTTVWPPRGPPSTTADSASGGDLSTTTDLGLATEASFALLVSPTAHFSASALRSSVLDYVWARTNLVRDVAGGGLRGGGAFEFGIGPEATLETTSAERSIQAGVVLMLDALQRALSLELRAGVTRRRHDDGTRDARPYVGFDLSREY